MNKNQMVFIGFEEFTAESFQRGSVPSFRPAMLTLAREAMGFNQKNLADLSLCNQGRISRIEAGELLPQENDIQKFVEHLQQKREFFFQTGEARPTGVSFYRKQAMPMKALCQHNARMNIRRLEIEKQVGTKNLQKRKLPFLPIEKIGSAKKAAQALRREWGFDKGAIQCLTQLVEETGCVIEDYSYPSAKWDGLCIRSTEKIPVIFLNKSSAKSRRRLSLAHELGHLVMHSNPHKDVETEAWDFAGEFLMPSDEIEKHFEDLNLDKLGQLKKQWLISMQAILFRAKKLNKISDSYYRYLWMQIGKCGYRVSEPFEDLIPDEKPTELENRLKTST